MKKKIIIVLSAVLMLAGVGHAGNFDSIKQAGDITIKATIDSNPLKVGDNALTIELIDKSGKVITDAEVDVYYFMPSMPAMNYEVRAAVKGKKYAAVIKPTMPGAWDADIRFRVPGGDMQKVTISFEAQ